jgi:hypothetical protein
MTMIDDCILTRRLAPPILSQQGRRLERSAVWSPCLVTDHRALDGQQEVLHLVALPG